MDSAFLPAVARYLARHSEVTITVTSGVVVSVALLVMLMIRQLTRATLSGGHARSTLRRWDVAVWPLLLVVAVVIVERFRLLA